MGFNIDLAPIGVTLSTFADTKHRGKVSEYRQAQKELGELATKANLAERSGDPEQIKAVQAELDQYASAHFKDPEVLQQVGQLSSSLDRVEALANQLKAPNAYQYHGRDSYGNFGRSGNVYEPENDVIDFSGMPTGLTDVLDKRGNIVFDNPQVTDYKGGVAGYADYLRYQVNQPQEQWNQARYANIMSEQGSERYNMVMQLNPQLEQALYSDDPQVVQNGINEYWDAADKYSELVMGSKMGSMLYASPWETETRNIRYREGRREFMFRENYKQKLQLSRDRLKERKQKGEKLGTTLNAVRMNTKTVSDKLDTLLGQYDKTLTNKKVVLQAITSGDSTAIVEALGIPQTEADRLLQEGAVFLKQVGNEDSVNGYSTVDRLFLLDEYSGKDGLDSTSPKDKNRLITITLEGMKNSYEAEHGVGKFNEKQERGLLEDAYDNYKDQTEVNIQQVKGLKTLFDAEQTQRAEILLLNENIHANNTAALEALLLSDADPNSQEAFTEYANSGLLIPYDQVQLMKQNKLEFQQYMNDQNIVATVDKNIAEGKLQPGTDEWDQQIQSKREAEDGVIQYEQKFPSLPTSRITSLDTNPIGNQISNPDGGRVSLNPQQELSETPLQSDGGKSVWGNSATSTLYQASKAGAITPKVVEQHARIVTGKDWKDLTKEEKQDVADSVSSAWGGGTLSDDGYDGKQLTGMSYQALDEFMTTEGVEPTKRGANKPAAITTEEIGKKIFNNPKEKRGTKRSGR